MMSHSFSWPRTLLGVRKPLNAALRTRVVSAMCTPHHVDDYLELFDPVWSLREVRARVASVQPEASDTTSLWLQPNENWRGFRAGQFVSMSVRAEGVRYLRSFSLSSAPEDGALLRVTIKCLRGGRVGHWAAHAARRGDVVGLSQALGNFVLPDPVPAKLLFISGGSGITPVMSMVRHLLATAYNGTVVCLHYARHEPIFAAEMAELARRHSQLCFVPIRTRGDSAPVRLGERHFSPEQLEAVAPFWNDCEAFVCGPAALHAAVTELFQTRGLAQRLHEERFVSAVQLPVTQASARHRITFANSGRTIDGNASAPLLDQAEHAGLRPASGCRMGICHSCKCRKLSGSVRNVLTGAVSHENEEDIQLCVNTPHSDVILDL